MDVVAWTGLTVYLYIYIKYKKNLTIYYISKPSNRYAIVNESRVILVNGFIFVIVYRHFDWKQIRGGFFVYYLFIHVFLIVFGGDPVTCMRREASLNTINWFNPVTCCVCPKSWSGFPSAYAVVFSCVQWFEVRGRWGDIDDHHCWKSYWQC